MFQCDAINLEAKINEQNFMSDTLYKFAIVRTTK